MERGIIGCVVGEFGGRLCTGVGSWLSKLGVMFICWSVRDGSCTSMVVYV